MAETNVIVGTNWHPVKLVCSNTLIQVFFDGTRVISTNDTDNALQPFSNGGVSLDMWTQTTPYTMSVSNFIVTPIP